MRELDRCDFCEEPADGVYEVVPDTVPSGARRLVLCTACRDTLAGVVDPLLDALDGVDAATEDHSSAVTVEPAVPDVELDDASDAADQDTEGADGATVETDDEPSTESETTDDGTAADEQADGDTADRPRGYAQIVRLLRNRPGAMTRTDLAELAAGAYDLSSTEVETAVDAAVENGHLEETAQGLRTP